MIRTMYQRNASLTNRASWSGSIHHGPLDDINPIIIHLRHISLNIHINDFGSSHTADCRSNSDKAEGTLVRCDKMSEFSESVWRRAFSSRFWLVGRENITRLEFLAGCIGSGDDVFYVSIF